MTEKRCENDTHVWQCQQQAGQVGELVTNRLLTQDQIKTISRDTLQMNIVCPGGVVICSLCGAPFPHSHTSESQKVDFNALQTKLKRIECV